MTKRLSFVLAVVLMLSLVATGCGGGSNDQPASGNGEAITLRISHVLQENHPSHLSMVEVLKPEIEENSNGRIKVEIYPNAQLGSDRQAIESVSLGSLEMTMPGGAVLAGFYEEYMIFDLPFLYMNREEAFAAWDGELGDQLSEGLASQNMMILGFGENGLRHVTNDLRPIETPDDLRGLKIRVMENPIHLKTFESLGANPTPIAFGELFTALQQGTVDAQENPLAIINSSKFAEVQDYLSLTGHVFGNAPYLISMDFYNSLDADLQEVVRDAVKNTEQRQRQMLTEQEEADMQALIDAGMQVNELTAEQKQAFIDLVQPAYDLYIEKFGEDLLLLVEGYNR